LKICLPSWTPVCLGVHLPALLHTLPASLYVYLPSCTPASQAVHLRSWLSIVHLPACLAMKFTTRL
jgi:hypothetical protein